MAEKVGEVASVEPQYISMVINSASFSRRSMSIAIDTLLLYSPLFIAMMTQIDQISRMDDTITINAVTGSFIMAGVAWSFRVMGLSPGMFLTRVRIIYRRPGIMNRIRSYLVRLVVCCLSLIYLTGMPFYVIFGTLTFIARSTLYAPSPLFVIMSIVLTVDYAWMLFDETRQTLHDKIAGVNIELYGADSRGEIIGVAAKYCGVVVIAMLVGAEYVESGAIELLKIVSD